MEVDVDADVIDGCVPAARMHTCTPSCTRSCTRWPRMASCSDGLMHGAHTHQAPPLPTRLFHPADAPYLSPAGERNTACIYSRVDVSRAAAASRQHGAFARAQPHVATVRRGDLLYLPLGWWHAVRGSQERNISVNFWFELHPSKRDAACPEEGGAAAA